MITNAVDSVMPLRATHGRPTPRLPPWLSSPLRGSRYPTVWSYLPVLSSRPSMRSSSRPPTGWPYPPISSPRSPMPFDRGATSRSRCVPRRWRGPDGRVVRRAVHLRARRARQRGNGGVLAEESVRGAHAAQRAGWAELAHPPRAHDSVAATMPDGCAGAGRPRSLPPRSLANSCGGRSPRGSSPTAPNGESTWRPPRRLTRAGNPSLGDIAQRSSNVAHRARTIIRFFDGPGEAGTRPANGKTDP